MLEYGVLQVCTGVMLHGYPLVKQLCGGLQARNKPHSVFNCIECVVIPMQNTAGFRVLQCRLMSVGEGSRR